MIIIGLDPGIAIVGWAILEKKNTSVQLIQCGKIVTPKEEKKEQRLVTIYKSIESILKTFQPDVSVVEELFFSTNVKTAITVSEARGVILMTLAKNKIPVVSYTPRVIKSVITGDGSADKNMIQTMITKILCIKEAPKPDDISDAIAIGLTYAYQEKTTL